jgi:hypothetical protein
MLAKLDHKDNGRQPVPSTPKVVESSTFVTVRGVVRSAGGGKPIAGARVGLLPLGETIVTESTLLTWGSTNGEGEFKLNRPVPPGRYTLRATAFSRQPYTGDVEIGRDAAALIIEMRASSDH